MPRIAWCPCVRHSVGPSRGARRLNIVRVVPGYAQAKRLHAITVLMAAAMAVPLGTMQYLVSYTPSPDALPRLHFWGSVITCVMCSYVLNFYMEKASPY